MTGAAVGRGPLRRRFVPGLAGWPRWRAMGVTRTVFAWTAIRWLYLLGGSPARLARLYTVVR